MELATGRVISSSSGNKGSAAPGGRAGPDSGRSSSGRDNNSSSSRDLEYVTRTKGERETLGGREYSREVGRGGSDRDRDRDHERKERGSSKGGSKQQQRLRGSAESRSGSRHYGENRDRGYRNSGHRDRSR